jgi:hypothetical protein
VKIVKLHVKNHVKVAKVAKAVRLHAKNHVKAAKQHVRDLRKDQVIGRG